MAPTHCSLHNTCLLHLLNSDGGPRSKLLLLPETIKMQTKFIVLIIQFLLYIWVYHEHSTPIPDQNYISAHRSFDLKICRICTIYKGELRKSKWTTNSFGFTVYQVYTKCTFNAILTFVQYIYLGHKFKIFCQIYASISLINA